ncbi:hypothetical protein ABW21_db0208959 [Orbilia brochopaga]|nr:hypothetical protein ABW21_db0208959 [Drechslerella brochopaga]
MKRSLSAVSTETYCGLPNRKKRISKVPAYTICSLKRNIRSGLIGSPRTLSEGDLMRGPKRYKPQGYRRFSSPEKTVTVENSGGVEAGENLNPEPFDLSRYADESEFIRPATSTWGPSVIFGGHNLGYSCVSAESEDARVFNAAVETFCAWVEEHYRGGYAFTLLRRRATPTLILILYKAGEVPASCPAVPFPLQILSGEIVNFILKDYKTAPKNPWFDNCLRPGSSLACRETGSFGGFVTAANGKTYGLTAGHVGRKLLGEEAFSEAKLRIDSPSQVDLRLARWKSKGKTFIQQQRTKDAKGILKEKVRMWKEHREDPERKLEAQKAHKEHASCNSRLNAWKEIAEAAKAAETCCGTVVASYVGESSYGVQEKGWKRIEDWAVFDIESDRMGCNALQLWGKEVAFADTTAMVPGQIVLKRGRSTGVTFGRVNGVRLNIRMEDKKKATAEWIILPLDTEDIWKTDSMKKYRETGWRDDLGRNFVSEKFGDIGDSGSLILEAQSQKVCGMVIGGFPEAPLPLTVATPIDLVFAGIEQRLGVKVAFSETPKD